MSQVKETISDEKIKFNLRTFVLSCINSVNYKYFFAWEIVNFIIIGIIYCLIHVSDHALYPTTSMLSIISITLWSFILSTLTYQIKALMKYLVCILLPYSAILADVLNHWLKNKAYFLSHVFICFLLGSIIIAINILIYNSNILKRLPFKILILIWNIICAVLLHFFILVLINTLLGNVSFDYDAIVAVCQTNFKEAIGYFSRLNHRYQLLIYTITLLIVIMIINVKPLFLFERENKVNLHMTFIYAVLCIFFFVMAVYIFQSRLYYPNIFKLMAAPVSYFQENKKFKERRANYDAFIREKFSQEPLNPEVSGIFVIIIGESLNRNYMSAYGYHVDTTPFQRKMAEDNEIYLFKYPYSAYAQTIRCIAYMLTNQNQYDNLTLSLGKSISLFEIARYNKFTTRWFSAQGTCLLLDSPTALIASSAEHTFSLPMVRSDINHKITDMDMIKYLPDKLNEKEFIVIQLMGSHYPYSHVFPSDFMKDSQLSDYEKSVCYNDIVVQKLFEYFRERHASAILYISDHSEEIENNIGHDPRKEVFSQVMTEIPFWLYISPEYAAKHDGLSNRLKRASERVFTADLFFEFMISLMNLKSSFLTSTNDILSDNYFLTESNALTLGGTVKLNIKIPSKKD